MDFELDLPRSPRTSPHLDIADRRNLTWVQAHKLVEGSAALRRYRSWRLPALAACFFPDSTPDGLCLGADMMGWLFPFDDLFDGPLGHDPEQVARFIARMRAIVRRRPDRPARHRHTPATSAFTDVWRRSTATMSADWRRRAAANWAEYFESYEAEASNRVEGRALTLESYFAVRRASAAVRPILDMNEPACGFELPDRLYSDRDLQDALGVLIEAVFLIADIFSVEKEDACGDPHNCVFVVEDIEGISRDRAVRWVVDMIRERLSLFDVATREWLAKIDREGADSHTAERFVDGMFAMLRGIYDWSRTSGRYTEEQVATGTTRGLSDDVPR